MGGRAILNGRVAFRKWRAQPYPAIFPTFLQGNLVNPWTSYRRLHGRDRFHRYQLMHNTEYHPRQNSSAAELAKIMQNQHREWDVSSVLDSSFNFRNREANLPAWARRVRHLGRMKVFRLRPTTTTEGLYVSLVGSLDRGDRPKMSQFHQLCDEVTTSRDFDYACRAFRHLTMALIAPEKDTFFHLVDAAVRVGRTDCAEFLFDPAVRSTLRFPTVPPAVEFVLRADAGALPALPDADGDAPEEAS
eukprot:TRINITY_DN22965_c0_g1_i1.p1 TRINITY_DN22965_c0_g1~~TRINITY_DN22965_c0_g1_i1.p1  ORF type:complete len:280 (+),score=33.31 TRINITY_DN22965_c0_g1_i1:105-842(+)